MVSLPFRDDLTVQKNLFAHENVSKLQIAYFLDRFHVCKNKTKT